MKYLEYKGYTGTIEYSKEDDLLFGKIIGIKSLISYEGKTGKLLEKDFIKAVNHYLEDCMSNKILPEKPFKGSFNVRVSPKIHQQAVLAAQENQTSLNHFVTEAIIEKLGMD
jgi:predicted HicB family RNase H-like nuclease